VNAVWPNGDPRVLARAILADPRFHGTAPGEGSGSSLLGTIVTWLERRLGELLNAVGHALGTRSPLNVTIGALFLAAAVVALAYAIVRFVRLPRSRRRFAPARVTGLDREPASGELVALTLAAARDERWQAAASALTRAALRALDERGRLPFDPARTAREARLLLGDAAFDTFVREATTALFAAQAATPERFARLRAAYGQTFGAPI
jgi:hypothetical protein